VKREKRKEKKEKNNDSPKKNQKALLTHVARRA
jgi:hypothetical protein